jgi:hypothetical protein
MDLIDKIREILQSIKANLTLIRVGGLLLLLGIFVASMLSLGSQRREISELSKTISALNTKNDLMFEDIRIRDSLILIREGKIGEIRDSLVIEQRAGRVMKDKYEVLKRKYEALADSLLNVTADSSYSFLIREAYPFTGPMKYPFNEPQVRGIHLTFLQKSQLEGMNVNLTGQISLYERQLALKDTLCSETSKVLAMVKQTNQDLKTVIGNKDLVIGEQERQIKREHRRRIFWQITSGVASALAIGFAL